MTKKDMMNEGDAPTLLTMMQQFPDIVDNDVSEHFSNLFRKHPATQFYDKNGIHHDPNPQIEMER